MSRYIPSTVTVGPYGRVVTNAYHEFDGPDGVVRVYTDRVVVGDRGQHIVVKGEIATIPTSRIRDAWSGK